MAFCDEIGTLVMIKILLSLSVAILLNACVSDDIKKSESVGTTTTTAEAVKSVHSLTQVDLSAIGTAKAITTMDTSLLVINQDNELWELNKDKVATKLVDKAAVPIIATRLGVSLADMDSNLMYIRDGKVYHSTIKLMPNAGLIQVSSSRPAMLAVMDDEGVARLVRIELIDDKLIITAKADTPILPDAQPNLVQIGHHEGVAILASPDNFTYRHGVLGDDWEAKELLWLDTQTLKPLAKSLKLNDTVFEHNRLETIPKGNGSYIVTTVAGGNQGARTVLIDNVDGALQIMAQSEPLPINRWQSPFVAQQELYAVQMPHLIGKLVQYDWQDNKLIEKELGFGYSNHKLGSYETNLAVSMNDMTDSTVLPMEGYQKLSVISKDGDISPLGVELPSPAIKGVSGRDVAFYLLQNGQVWVVAISNN